MSGTQSVEAPLAFLNDITVTPVNIQCEALTPVRMPPFPGPSLRGVIGNALLEAWCESRPFCTGACAHPDTCLFYERFARERDAPGAGENQPKPWILDVPPPPGLTALISSGVVSPPYARGPALPGGYDLIERRQPWLLASGTQFDVRMSLLGRHGAWAPSLAALLRNRIFEIRSDAGRFAVAGTPVCMPSFKLSATAPAATAARLEFLTPLRLDPKGGWAGTPEALVQQVATSALVRAIKLHDNFCRNDGARLPKIELPRHTVSVRQSQLWRYWLPRLSNRQDRTMEIGGIVGSLELEGDLHGIMPLLQAGEILHAGQKATFGLGRIRTIIWH